MKKVYVAFATRRLERAYLQLRAGPYEERTLYSSISQALDQIKQDPACAVHLPRRLWPREYIVRYRITNLWKFDLPDGWRLIYTIKSDEIQVISIILEWFNHKTYEKRFNY